MRHEYYTREVTEVQRRADNLYYGRTTKRQLCDMVARLESETTELNDKITQLRLRVIDLENGEK